MINGSGEEVKFTYILSPIAILWTLFAVQGSLTIFAKAIGQMDAIGGQTSPIPQSFTRFRTAGSANILAGCLFNPQMLG
jgi:hypothetical protein